MPLTPPDLAAIATLLQPAPPDSATLAALRRRFPQLSITRCDASDIIGAEPVRRLDHLDLHLVDGSNHCWRLTADPAQATGLLLARRSGSTAS